MDDWLLILISVGLCAEVLAAVTYKGAQLAKITWKGLILTCLIFGGLQFAALGAGMLIADVLMMIGKLETGHDWMRTMATLLLVIATRYVIKAVEKKQFSESRTGLFMRSTAWTALVTSADALIAGIGFGFLNISFPRELLILEAVTEIFAVAGLYFGYRVGYRQSKGMYWMGAACMACSGMIVLF